LFGTASPVAATFIAAGMQWFDYEKNCTPVSLYSTMMSHCSAPPFFSTGHCHFNAAIILLLAFLPLAIWMEASISLQFQHCKIHHGMAHTHGRWYSGV